MSTESVMLSSFCPSSVVPFSSCPQSFFARIRVFSNEIALHNILYARTYLKLNIFTKWYLPLLACDAFWFLILLLLFKSQLDPLNWFHKSLMDYESSVFRHLLLVLGRVTLTTKNNSNKVMFLWPLEQSGIPRRRAILQLVYEAFGLGDSRGHCDKREMNQQIWWLEWRPPLLDPAWVRLYGDPEPTHPGSWKFIIFRKEHPHVKWL